jgi:hypothetical protein
MQPVARLPYVVYVEYNGGRAVFARFGNKDEADKFRDLWKKADPSANYVTELD